MTARAFLVRGLLAGLLAGFAAFLVAYTAGEPYLESAIALEASGSHHHEAAAGGDHPADESGTEVSRADQRTWGLLTGTLAVGVALGGLVALVAAGTLGRIGRLLPEQSTALVVLLGFVAYALVPFLKYPATPPGVGRAETIGDRTALYFGFVVVSVVAVTAATWAAVRLRHRIGTYGAVVAGAVGYVLVMVGAGHLFAPVREAGDFPADTLWLFRRGALLTLATTWAVIGVVLTGLVARLHVAHAAEVRRRELAASL